jgi:hypothetical protein
MGLLMTRLTIDIWKLHDLQLVIQLCDGYPKISPRPLPAGRLFVSRRASRRVDKEGFSSQAARG